MSSFEIGIVEDVEVMNDDKAVDISVGCLAGGFASGDDGSANVAEMIIDGEIYVLTAKKIKALSKMLDEAALAWCDAHIEDDADWVMENFPEMFGLDEDPLGEEDVIE